jgi:hypothetical protein
MIATRRTTRSCPPRFVRHIRITGSTKPPQRHPTPRIHGLRRRGSRRALPGASATELVIGAPRSRTYLLALRARPTVIAPADIGWTGTERASSRPAPSSSPSSGANATTPPNTTTSRAHSSTKSLSESSTTNEPRCQRRVVRTATPLRKPRPCPSCAQREAPQVGRPGGGSPVQVQFEGRARRGTPPHAAALQGSARISGSPSRPRLPLR